MDQITSANTTFWSSCKASHTVAEPSTILLPHGGCPACSSSHPLTELHSVHHLCRYAPPITCRYLYIPPTPPSTISSLFAWYCLSHIDWPPPSPVGLKIHPGHAAIGLWVYRSLGLSDFGCAVI
ncbi:hypothetical protein ACFX2I_029662 [Malus domestica]